MLLPDAAAAVFPEQSTITGDHAEIDLHAAEALAAAMAGWDADEMASYREAVSQEVERLGTVAPDGFLAAEVLALTWIDAAADRARTERAA